MRANIPPVDASPYVWFQMHVDSSFGMDEFVPSDGQSSMDCMSLCMELAKSNLAQCKVSLDVLDFCCFSPIVSADVFVLQGHMDLPFVSSSACESFMHSISHGISLCVMFSAKNLRVAAVNKRKRKNDSSSTAADDESSSGDAHDNNNPGRDDDDESD